MLLKLAKEVCASVLEEQPVDVGEDLATDGRPVCVNLLRVNHLYTCLH